jgi:transposase
MLTVKEGATIYIYNQPVDMRKAINGLVGVIVDCLESNPQSGDLYIFHNRGGDKAKLVYWDVNGFALYYKRLDKGRFKFSKIASGNKQAITEPQLRALLIGIDFTLLDEYPVDSYSDFF